MTETVIKIQNLSKAYRIGLESQQHDTLGAAILSWLKSPFKNFLQLKSLANITSGNTDSDVFWALKDIQFDVKKGDVIGVIGKNGAGKSTLLKILSRITEPTDGRIEIHGRVASLLEVGTGFNPELTGRENVYLNGTILGMTKKEIDQKFSEIIAFSGVEKFIDTPVKRYSSGMKVRLAFSVAAHLDPEILIIDEVLAVGDAEFQKKCLGKMKDVSQTGRTVLFVSHNMGAVQELCTRAVFLSEGKLLYDGSVDEAISKYLVSAPKQSSFTFPVKDVAAQLLEITFTDKEGNKVDTFDIKDEINIVFKFDIRNTLHDPGFGFVIYRDGSPIFEEYSIADQLDFNKQTGVHTLKYTLKPMFLKEGVYTLELGSWGHNLQLYYNDSDAPTFEIEAISVNMKDKSYRKDRRGHIITPGKWSLISNTNQ